MGLVEKAKSLARKKEQEEEAQRQRERKEHARLSALVKSLSKAALEGMREFDEVTCKAGKLQLITDKEAAYYRDRIAILRLLRGHGKDYNNEDLLYVYAGIESGFFDGSDDCRDIPYTCARVRIVSPHYDEPYHGAEKRGHCFIKAPFGSEATQEGKDSRSVAKLLERVAEYLSPLF